MFQNLGDTLRLLREERGLKQYQVAAAARITRPMLSGYERGRQQPTLVTLERILRAMRATVLDLALTLEALEARHPESTLRPPHIAATTSLHLLPLQGALAAILSHPEAQELLRGALQVLDSPDTTTSS